MRREIIFFVASFLNMKHFLKNYKIEWEVPDSKNTLIIIY